LNLPRFQYYNVGVDSLQDSKPRLYRFRNDSNETYIVEVFELEHSIYAFKFYLKKHKDCKDKYSKGIAQYSVEERKKASKAKRMLPSGASNFFKVLNTVLEIAITQYLLTNTKASFFFMGAAKDSEKTPEKTNPDNTVENTIRYRNYWLYCKRHLSWRKFEYMEMNSSSILLLRNNDNKDQLSLEVAQNYITKTIIPALNES